MEQLSHNLEIAHSIKAQVKHKVICSNDIIPRASMPALYEHLIPLYKAIFGSQLIEQYLAHSRLTALIRTTILDEAQKFIQTALHSTVALSITDYGIGECQEIASLCYHKLIARSENNVQFVCIAAPKKIGQEIPYAHCLIVIGDDKNQLKSPCHINALYELPEHMVVLDAYLDYVGPAKRYLQDQQAYLKQFNYHQIIVNDRPTSLHHQNITLIHENTEKLKARVACQHFYRHFLTLPLSSFSISELLPCHETALIQFLNDASGLNFSWGHNDYQVSAYANVSTEADYETAKTIQNRLQAGSFYLGNSQRLFVLHGINMQADLAHGIQANYRRFP